MQACSLSDFLCGVGIAVSYALLVLPTGTAQAPSSRSPARPLTRPWLLGTSALLLFWVTKGTSRCTAIILFAWGILLQGYAINFGDLDTKIARAIRARQTLHSVCASRWVSLGATLGAVISSACFLYRWWWGRAGW